MTTLKSVISNNLPTTLTTLYTNNTGNGAALKGVNVTHNRIPSSTTVAASTVDDWSYLGDIAVFGSLQGEGIPYPIVLSANRLLLIISMRGRRGTAAGGVSSGATLAQIVEWQTALGRYAAGPITRLDTLIDGANTYARATNVISGVAVTPTLVAVATTTASGNPFLYTINITGNTVSRVVRSVSLTNILANYSVNVCTVPGDTSKVAIFGASNSSTYTAAAYSVSTSANPAAVGSTFTTGISYHATDPRLSASLHQLTSPTYMVAAYINDNSIAARILTFTSATNTWAAVGASTTISGFAGIIVTGGSGDSLVGGVQVKCLSDGSGYSSVICSLNVSGQFAEFAFQTSSNSITTNIVQASHQGQTFTSLCGSYNIGLTKAAFVGKGRVWGAIHGGTVTSNLGITPQDGAGAHTMIYPFEDRPLTSINTQGTSLPLQYYGRTGLTTTSFGNLAIRGNYFPFGATVGKHIMYSDTAEGYFIGQGTTVYLVGLDGVVKGERNDPNSTNIGSPSSTSNAYVIKALTVGPNGSVRCVSDQIGGFSGTVPIEITVNNTSNFARTMGTTVATTAENFGSVEIDSSVLTIHRAADIISWKGADNITRALIYGYVFIASGINSITIRHDLDIRTLTSSVSTQVSSASGNYNGINIPTAIMQVTPVSAHNINGKFSIVGNVLYSASSGAQNIAYTSPPGQLIDGATFNTLSGDNVISGLGTPSAENATVVSRSQSGISAVATGIQYSSLGRGYIWISNLGNVLNGYMGNYVNISQHTLSPQVAAAKNHVSIAWSGSSSATPTAGILLHIGVSAGGQLSTVDGTSGTDVPALRLTGQASTVAKGAGLAQDASVGTTNTKFALTVSGDGSDFYVTPTAGSAVAIGTFNRSSDTYYIPSGYSIKARAIDPNQLDVMLTILEEV